MELSSEKNDSIKFLQTFRSNTVHAKEPTKHFVYKDIKKRIPIILCHRRCIAILLNRCQPSSILFLWWPYTGYFQRRSEWFCNYSNRYGYMHATVIRAPPYILQVIFQTFRVLLTAFVLSLTSFVFYEQNVWGHTPAPLWTKHLLWDLYPQPGTKMSDSALR